MNGQTVNSESLGSGLDLDDGEESRARRAAVSAIMRPFGRAYYRARAQENAPPAAALAALARAGFVGVNLPEQYGGAVVAGSANSRPSARRAPPRGARCRCCCRRVRRRLCHPGDRRRRCHRFRRRFRRCYGRCGLGRRSARGLPRTNPTHLLIIQPEQRTKLALCAIGVPY